MALITKEIRQILNNMDVNTAVINFHKFLINSYEILKNIESNEVFEEIQNDFYQTNWKLLVESIVCTIGKEYLSEYGQGADCNPQSSRVSFPDKKANTKIICKKIKPKYRNKRHYFRQLY